MHKLIWPMLLIFALTLCRRHKRSSGRLPIQRAGGTFCVVVELAWNKSFVNLASGDLELGVFDLIIKEAKSWKMSKGFLL
jgi:hypothetical protein